MYTTWRRRACQLLVACTYNDTNKPLSRQGVMSSRVDPGRSGLMRPRPPSYGPLSCARAIQTADLVLILLNLIKINHKTSMLHRRSRATAVSVWYWGLRALDEHSVVLLLSVTAHARDNHCACIACRARSSRRNQGTKNHAGAFRPANTFVREHTFINSATEHANS